MKLQLLKQEVTGKDFIEMTTYALRLFYKRSGEVGRGSFPGQNRYDDDSKAWTDASEYSDCNTNVNAAEWGLTSLPDRWGTYKYCVNIGSGRGSSVELPTLCVTKDSKSKCVTPSLADNLVVEMGFNATRGLIPVRETAKAAMTGQNLITLLNAAKSFFCSTERTTHVYRYPGRVVERDEDDTILTDITSWDTRVPDPDPVYTMMNVIGGKQGGWCVNNARNGGFARYYVSDTTISNTQDLCNTDESCVAYAVNDNSPGSTSTDAILYSTNKCTEPFSCDKDDWQDNPELIVGSYSSSSWNLPTARCYVKKIQSPNIISISEDTSGEWSTLYPPSSPYEDGGYMYTVFGTIKKPTIVILDKERPSEFYVHWTPNDNSCRDPYVDSMLV